jgi:TIR domain
MPDIFVSYAHQDRDWVERFAESLRAAGGFDVWWDHNILPGEQFDDAIQQAMDGTRCVVVVWSKASIASRWVRTEAREAARREMLVPVMIESVMPPLEFRSFETADVSDWHGEPDHENFREITEALRLAIAKTSAVDRTPAQPLSRDAQAVFAGGHARTRRGRAFAAGGIAAALLLVLVLVGWLVRRPAVPASATVSSSAASAAPSPALTPSAVLPNLTYGVWTLHDAIDDDKNNWNNSVIKFTSQEEVADGLELRGSFSWRFDNTLVGTEEFTGHYVRATRQLFMEGTSVKDLPHPGPAHLAVGSYSAVVSDDGRAILDGRWGQTAQSEAGVLGRWQASR